MDTKNKLKNQITDAADNVIYTNIAHWNIVNRLKTQDKGIKCALILLTAFSTGGFLTTLFSGVSWLSWMGALTSALALALNMYTLNFRLTEDIKKHMDAANELWDVREEYRSLLVDFDDMPIEQIRKKRDELMDQVGQINKKYPGTDNRSYIQAKKMIDDYTFEDGEAEETIHSDRKNNI